MKKTYSTSQTSLKSDLKFSAFVKFFLLKKSVKTDILTIKTNVNMTLYFQMNE